MGKRVVYFGDSNAESQSDSIGYYFRKALMDAFTSLAYDVIYMNVGQEKEAARRKLKEIGEDGYQFGLGFGGTTYQKILDIGECVRAPYVAILVDPLFHQNHDAFFKPGLDYLLLCMADETELKDGISFCPNVRQAFMTTGFSFVHESAKLQPKPISERNLGIVYIGNYYSSLQRTWPNVSPAVTSILNDIIDLLLADPLMPYIEAVRNVFSGLGMEVSKEWFRVFCVMYLPYAMLYLRGWTRREAVRALANAGFRIDVWGGLVGSLPVTGSWTEEKNIILHSPVSFRDMLSIMAEAQMTLSVYAFPGGVSERLSSGMLNGSVVLTDRSTYYDRNFVSGEDSLAFTWGKLEEYPFQVMDLFRDKDRMQHMADLGRKKILDAHLPIHLAKRIELQVALYKEQHGLS